MALVSIPKRLTRTDYSRRRTDGHSRSIPRVLGSNSSSTVDRSSRSLTYPLGIFDIFPRFSTRKKRFRSILRRFNSFKKSLIFRKSKLESLSSLQAVVCPSKGFPPQNKQRGKKKKRREKEKKKKRREGKEKNKKKRKSPLKIFCLRRGEIDICQSLSSLSATGNQRRNTSFKKSSIKLTPSPTPRPAHTQHQFHPQSYPLPHQPPNPAHPSQPLPRVLDVISITIDVISIAVDITSISVF